MIMEFDVPKMGIGVDNKLHNGGVGRYWNKSAHEFNVLIYKLNNCEGGKLKPYKITFESEKQR